MGSGVRRRELGLRTGEQQHQPCYPTSGVLIINNCAHSSRAAAIICFASATTLQNRTRPSTSICNVVSSVPRIALSALCILHPLQYPVHDPRDCHSSHPQLHLRPSSVEKHLLSAWTHPTIISNLSTGSAYISLCHLVHQISHRCRLL